MTSNPRPLSGVFAPIPTPFTASGKVDARAMMCHLDWLASTRLDGVLVLGSNGEFPSLTASERTVVARTAATADSRLLKILNVGSCALQETIDAANEAAGLGFDAVLCPPPFYYRRASATGVARFFASLLDQSPLPVLLYHIPSMTGIAVDDEILAAVVGHARFAGVKDSTGSLDELRRFSAGLADRALMIGNDRMVRACINIGGAGSITACASIAPDLVSSAVEDDHAFVRLVDLRIRLEKDGLIPSVKAVLASRGLGRAEPRPPLMPLSPSRTKRLLRDIAAIME